MNNNNYTLFLQIDSNRAKILAKAIKMNADLQRSGVTNEVQYFFTGRGTIRSFTFSNCDKLTDDACTQLSNAMAAIQSVRFLSLINCEVTSRGAARLFRGCRSDTIYHFVIEKEKIL